MNELPHYPPVELGSDTGNRQWWYQLKLYNIGTMAQGGSTCFQCRVYSYSLNFLTYTRLLSERASLRKEALSDSSRVLQAAGHTI